MKPNMEKQPRRARASIAYTAWWGMWIRRSRPRRECASTTTKYSCFIVSPNRTLFWIRADEKRGGPVGLFQLQNYHWRISNCNRDCAAVSTLIFRCKSLIYLVLLILTVPSRLPGTLFLRNLVERRSLLFQLVRRDFQQRFVGSAMGWIWSLIHPLVLLVSWTFVFQYCLGKQTPPGAPAYPLFLFSGMLPWMLFSETVQRSAPSLLDQASLITKSVFPAEVVPVSVFLSTLVSHLIAVALMVTAAGVWINQISIFLVLLPFYMLTVGLFAVGVGWIAASLHVFLRDTAQVLNVILIFWFWATPIFIDEAKFPAAARFLLYVNPLYYAVRSYRAILLHSTPPHFEDLAISAAFGVSVFIVGGLFFRYMKRGFA